MALFIVFQDSVLSALPYITSWLFGIGFSHVADWLISKGFLSVISSYKMFNSIGMQFTVLFILKLIFCGNKFTLSHNHAIP